MLSNIKKRTEGFTIIEVMIVLAIAGLIMLIVFLAVPALQRNARNTQRRNDAGHLSALISEYVANNNGKLPSGFGGGAGQLDLGNEKFSIMDTPATIAANNTFGSTSAMNVNTTYTCSSNLLALGAGARAYAVSFQVETSTAAPANQCV